MKIRILTMMLMLAPAAPAGADDVKRGLHPNGKSRGYNRSNTTIAWQITENLKAPESAYFDADSGFLFLSQIGEGGGMAKDGDGWISKLTPDGKMVTNRWVTGFHAPKGLRSHDGILWVSDIDKLIGIDIAKGKIVKTVSVPDAELLNDVACAPDGTVYVTDMFANKVWRYHTGKLKVIAQGDQLEHPNGILIHNGKLILACWGREIQDDFSTKTLGHVLAIDLETGKLSRVTPNPTGNLDGIETDGQGGFILTDWLAGKILQINGKGETSVLFTLPKGVADHAFLVKERLLILPEMLENRLTAYKVGERMVD